jgi:NurA domain-containing protein
MLYARKVRAELDRRRDQLAAYQDHYGSQLAAYRAALAALGERFPSADSLRAAQRALSANGEAARATGAQPTAEYDAWLAGGGRGLPSLPFGQTFAHHEEARAWAECLRGTTTFAVDGSQLLPWRDASVPVALVQAGLFENPHAPTPRYVKDVETELVLPEDLLGGEPDALDARNGEAFGYSTAVVHLRRYQLEVRTIVARMRHHALLRERGQSAGPVIAFFDGSLIVSFALKMAPQYREPYVAAALRLLRASEEYRVPLVAYIDTSYARDIVTMLGALAPAEAALPETRGVHDALLWQGHLRWGDRTPAFLSARDDLTRMGYGDQADEVAFVYFQAATDRPPARLELPRWVLDAGLLDDVMRTVRAETIAGNGYPYPIESADAVAVISAPDRAQFYALLQDFAADAGLALSFSRKALSKNRRRV